MSNSTNKTHLALATISIVVLLGAVLVVPYLSAFADLGVGIKKTSVHKKDRKGLSLALDPLKDPPARCLHGVSAKYNKHCF